VGVFSKYKGPHTITKYSPAFGNVPHPRGFAKVFFDPSSVKFISYFIDVQPLKWVVV
jgi:hypothetical protein